MVANNSTHTHKSRVSAYTIHIPFLWSTSSFSGLKLFRRTVLCPCHIGPQKTRQCPDVVPSWGLCMRLVWGEVYKSLCLELPQNEIPVDHLQSMQSTFSSRWWFKPHVTFYLPLRLYCSMEILLKEMIGSPNQPKRVVTLSHILFNPGNRTPAFMTHIAKRKKIELTSRVVKSINSFREFGVLWHLPPCQCWFSNTTM